MNKPSRRAVVRTGVWAVPVAAPAGAAPAFAGTGQSVSTVVDFDSFHPYKRDNSNDPDADC